MANSGSGHGQGLTTSDFKGRKQSLLKVTGLNPDSTLQMRSVIFFGGFLFKGQISPPIIHYTFVHPMDTFVFLFTDKSAVPICWHIIGA